ncbi:MAG TPA: DUF3137 domain-containing protein [Bacteroidales bacterium]|nr:DUF3137 domain-containing protein [Bacteroidales bacterium]
MRSTEELKHLYNTELKDDLTGLEQERIKIKRLTILLVAVALVFYIAFINIKNQGLQYTVAIIGVLIVLFGLGYTVIIYFKYRKQFKDKVVSKVINLINPDFHYNANRHIEVNEFNDSKIFSTKAERCNGDDYVSGKIEKTDFKFSELNAHYKTVSTEDGKKKTEWHSIFRGLFFHAVFNKSIQGTTHVLPDKAERLLGKFGQKLQKNKSRGELVKLEDLEFEKHFVVYSSSQIEARYILTPVMMESMVEICKKYGRKMHFSFKGERVYCAVEFNKGLFEPRIRKSGVNYNDVEEMYYLFALIETIIHEMNLNTRIWTKE